MCESVGRALWVDGGKCTTYCAAAFVSGTVPLTAYKYEYFSFRLSAELLGPCLLLIFFFCKIGIVAFLFVFDRYYLIMDKLGSKDSSRQF